MYIPANYPSFTGNILPNFSFHTPELGNKLWNTKCDKITTRVYRTFLRKNHFAVHRFLPIVLKTSIAGEAKKLIAGEAKKMDCL